MFKGKNTDSQREKQKHRNRPKPVIHQNKDPYGPRPMELDRVNQVKIQGNCYNCGKQGHRARDCRSKGKESQKIRKVEQQATPDEEEKKWLTENPLRGA